jgi:RHS repeat-associated protein
VRPPRLLLGAALIALSAAPLSAGRFVPADVPAAAFGRYRVSLDTTRVEDVDATVTQLLSICRCRIEPYAEEGFTGFLIAATPSAARMLSSDPRVTVVEEIASEAPTPAAAEPPSAVTPKAAPPAPLTESVAATAIPHIPVANAGITAWDTGSYTYDASGNIRAIGSTQIYTYDPYGRLAYGKVDAASRFHRYSYDRYGNLSTIITTDNGQTSTTSLSISGLTNRLSSNGAVYDAAGRLTSTTGTGLAFHYDGDGMPTWSQMPSGSLTQTKVQIYSATDERIGSMWIGPANGSDWTIRDASGQVLRRLHKSTTGQWSWQEDYVYRDGQMLAAEVATREKTLHYHLDHLGTPRLITGNGGAQVSLHTYDPFGAEVTSAAQAGTEAIKKFTGHERDTATVDYMHARYYQNGWGRFLSVDRDRAVAVRRPQSWNRFTYASNNPIVRFDPNGLRDVYVAIWNAQAPYVVGHGSVGHAAIFETNGRVLLSQFPKKHGVMSPNDQRSYEKTKKSEDGRSPDAVYKVHVPDDEKFDRAVAQKSKATTWLARPVTDNQTNCAEAVASALQSGGVKINEQNTFVFIPQTPLLPGVLQDALDKLAKSGGGVEPESPTKLDEVTSLSADHQHGN